MDLLSEDEISLKIQELWWSRMSPDDILTCLEHDHGITLSSGELTRMLSEMGLTELDVTRSVSASSTPSTESKVATILPSVQHVNKQPYQQNRMSFTADYDELFPPLSPSTPATSSKIKQTSTATTTSGVATITITESKSEEKTVENSSMQRVAEITKQLTPTVALGARATYSESVSIESSSSSATVSTSVSASVTSTATASGSSPVSSPSSPSPLSSPVLNTVYYRDSVPFTLKDVLKFAPDVRLHYNDAYMPTTIDSYIRGAILHGVREDGQPCVIHNPTQADLAFSDRHSTLEVLAENVMGEPVVGEIGARYIRTPVYTSVQVAENHSFFDLHFLFLFGFNGAQALRNLSGAPGHFNYVMRSLGEHQGDLESISVRVTADFSRVIAVRYEAHGDSNWLRPHEVLWTQGTHPQVRTALNSHASYSGYGKNSNDWVELENIKGLAAVVDIITESVSGFSLRNAHTDSILCAKHDWDQLVTLVHSSTLHRRISWNCGGVEGNAAERWCSLRPHHNHKHNLNVFGSVKASVSEGAMPGVGTYKWGKAKDNELWRIEPQSDGTVLVRSKVGGKVLSAHPTEPEQVVISADTGSKHQRWHQNEVGAFWRPYEEPYGGGVRLLGLDKDRRPSEGSEAWAAYQGRLGSYKVNKLTETVDVSGSALTVLEGLTAKAQALMAVGFLKAKKYFDPTSSDTFKSCPCEAPGCPTKSILHPTRPSPTRSPNCKRFRIVSHLSLSGGTINRSSTGIGVTAAAGSVSSGTSGGGGISRSSTSTNKDKGGSLTPSSPTLSSQPLVLSYDAKSAGHDVVVDVFNPNDPRQQWFMAPTSVSDRVLLFNADSNEILYAPRLGGKGQRATLYPASLVNEYSTWFVKGDQMTGCGLRIEWHDRLFLNVFQPGEKGDKQSPKAVAKTTTERAVGMWSWKGGEKFETWHFEEV